MPKSKSKSRKQKSQSTLNKLTTLHPLVIISFVSILLLVISANVQTTQVLTANSGQSILGDNENSSKDQDEDKSDEDKDDEDEDIPNEEDEDNIEDQDEDKSDEDKDDEDEDLLDEDSVESEQETEIKTADGQKIKTKIKNGVTTKIEIERGELKLKYEFKNGQLELKVENENGEEVELNEDELNELEDESVEVSAISGDTVAFTKNQISAITNFPLSVDIGTNLLILSTPEGQRIVTVLPDQAIQNLLKTGIVNTIDTSTDTQILDQLGSGNEVIKLELKNKDIVYRIKGSKEHKILGFIPVNTQATAFVSANSGEVVAQERSVLTSFVDLISS